MKAQALEHRHHHEGDRQGRDEAEDGNAPQERVPPTPPARGEAPGRHEKHGERDLHQQADRAQHGRDEGPGSVARREGPEDGGSHGRGKDDGGREGERQRGEVEDEEGASQETNSIATGGTRPAAAARPRKVSTARRPLSP